MSAEIKTLHVPFREWLDTEQKGRIAYTYHRPDQPTGGTKGDADFVLYAGNHCLHIEMKDKDTAVSANQVQRHNELKTVGITVHIVRDLAIAIRLATEWRSMIGNVVVKSVNQVEMDLCQWGRGVFRRGPSGAIQHVRPMGPGDENLPKL